MRTENVYFFIFSFPSASPRWREKSTLIFSSSSSSSSSSRGDGVAKHNTHTTRTAHSQHNRREHGATRFNRGRHDGRRQGWRRGIRCVSPSPTHTHSPIRHPHLSFLCSLVLGTHLFPLDFFSFSYFGTFFSASPSTPIPHGRGDVPPLSNPQPPSRSPTQPLHTRVSRRSTPRFTLVPSWVTTHQPFGERKKKKNDTCSLFFPFIPSGNNVHRGQNSGESPLSPFLPV